jgi:hypothetical protein
MKRVVAIVVTCVGCSDPGYVCDQNRAHVTWDGRCEFPPARITVDGDASDWESLLVYPIDCPECDPGQVAGVYATETTDGEIAIYASTIGAPFTDNRHRYYLDFGPLAFPYYSVGFAVQPASIFAFMNGTERVDGMPVRAAIGEAGIELAVPISALPFTAGARGYAQLEVAAFGGWEVGQDFFEHPVAGAAVCWDPDSSLCGPGI